MTGEPNSCSIYTAFNMDGNSPMDAGIPSRGMPEYSPMMPMGPPMQMPPMGPPMMGPPMGPPPMPRQPPPRPMPMPAPMPMPPRRPTNPQISLLNLADKYGHLFSIMIIVLVAGTAFTMLD